MADSGMVQTDSRGNLVAAKKGGGFRRVVSVTFAEYTTLRAAVEMPGPQAFGTLTTLLARIDAARKGE